ncbi:MAG: ADP-ribosylglycohydrolase family protein, partial [Planctomycetia bacterium]|nr:ADP-ribosylglycohydrolase family protein [Planctomycetia bacterium]
PDDWLKTWTRVNDRYLKDLNYRRYPPGQGGESSIDVKLNGAYVLMGLLHGKGDPDLTPVIACRCGQDSDCNPSNAAGILFTTIGRRGLPERFTSALDPKPIFSHTAYNFERLLAVCEKLAREAVVRAGGRIERDADGREVMVIGVVEPKPGKLEQCWAPGPPAGKRFSDAQRKEIVTKDP